MRAKQRLDRIHELAEEIRILESKHERYLLKLLQDVDTDDIYHLIMDGIDQRRKKCQAAIGEHIVELMRLDQGTVVIMDNGDN